MATEVPPAAESLLRRRRRYACTISSLAFFLWGLIVAAEMSQSPRAPSAAPNSGNSGAASASPLTGEGGGTPTDRTAARRGYEIAQSAAKRAGGRFERAREALANFLSEHFAGHVTEAERLIAAPPSEPASPVPAPPEVPERGSPQLRELLARQGALLARREELSTRVTIEHPEAQDVELRLAEVARELAAFDAGGGSQIVDLPRRAPVPPAVPIESPELRERQLQRHRQAVTSFESSQYEFELARKEWAESQSELLAAADRCAQWPTNAAPALSDESGPAGYPNASPWTRSWAVFSLALVFGALVAAWATPPCAVPIAEADLTRDLRLPLLGLLPDSSADLSAAQLPPGVRLVVLAAEIALAVLVFALIAQAMRETAFLGNLVSRPLPTMLEAVRRLAASTH